MITFERTSVMNMENAMRGARNPLNSWARGDSYVNDKGEFIFGENDLQPVSYTHLTLPTTSRV